MLRKSLIIKMMLGFMHLATTHVQGMETHHSSAQDPRSNQIFLKKIELVNLTNKYGENHSGLKLLEDVAEGEILWSRITGDKSLFTRKQLCKLMEENPRNAQMIVDFSCQSGEDLFTLPTGCLNNGHIDERQFINHSCNPNCGYMTDKDGNTYTVAMRPIRAGEELTKHYGTLETEASFTYGLACKCGSENCEGTWKFDLYRRTDPEAVRLMGFAKPELRKKAEALRSEFWHTPKCSMRRMGSSRPIKDQDLVLSALQNIAKGEDVAQFIDGKIKYVLLEQEEANCILKDGRLIANRDIAAGTDISLASQVNVYCDGIFDLFHLGHQEHIRNCRQYGTRLFVGVLSDENAIAYKREPIMSMEERMNVVGKFEGVYQVIPDAPMIVDEDFLQKWNIDVVCISPEYSAPDDTYYAVPRKKGIVKVMTRTPGISTTELINRIKKN